MLRMNNEDASAGGLAGLFIIFLVCAFFTAALGPVVDNINHVNNRMTNTPGLPMSQERMTTMELLSFAFGIMAFMILIASGINYIVVSMRQDSGDV